MESEIPESSVQDATQPTAEASTSLRSTKKKVNDFFMNNFYGAFLLNFVSEESTRIVNFLIGGLAGYLILRCQSRARRGRKQQRDDDLLRKLCEMDTTLKQILVISKEELRDYDDPAPTTDATSTPATSTGTEINESNSTNAPTVLPGQGSVHHESDSEASGSVLDYGNNSLETPPRMHGLEVESECLEVNRPGSHRVRNGLRFRGIFPNGSPSGSRYTGFPFNKVKMVKETFSNLLPKSSKQGQLIPIYIERQEATSSPQSNTQGVEVVMTMASVASTSDSRINQMNKTIQGVGLKLKGLRELYSSRIIQATVLLSKDNMLDIRALAKENMKFDKDFTLQLDRCLIYRRIPGEENSELLSLKEIQVPMILCSEFSAGVLTIKGLHLEGSEMRAATADGYVTLNPSRQPSESKFEVWKCMDRLPPSAKLDNIYVYAMKVVKVSEGKEVTVRSEACHIDNVTARTVLREWVPTTIGLLLVAVPLLRTFVPWIHWTMVSLQLTWLYPLLPALLVYFIHMLPASTEPVIMNWFERVALALSSFYVGTFNAFNLRTTYVRKRINEQIPHNDAYPLKEKTECLDDDAMFKGTSNTSQKKLTTTNERERADKDKEEEATKPKDSEVEVVNTTEWQWPSYQRDGVKWRLRESDEENKGPFAVYYNDTKCSWSEFVTLRIYSQPLLGILEELVPDQVKDQTKSYSEILSQELFHVYVEGKLQKYLSGGGETSVPSTKEIGDLTETQIHVSHLLRFLDQEFRTAKPRYLQMKTSGRVQWDMLWTLFIRKEKVVYRLIGHEVCGEVISTRYNLSSRLLDKKKVFSILLSVWDYDCKNYRKCDMKRSIEEYEWEQEITKLSVYPFHYKLDTKNAEEYFLSRGKKFYELVMKTDHCFMQYKGLKFVKDLRRRESSRIYDEDWDNDDWDDEWTLRENADGRVMIDHRSSAKLNPDLIMGNAEPAQNVLLGAEIELEDSNLDTSLDPGSDPNLVFAPAIVYGFSFSLRRWGAFSVSGFENIMFRSDAFESLVMERDRKDMIFMLVNEYIKEPVAGDLQMTSIDPIAKKGQGCIILCHGPPGTGKTLTAESIAEKLICPLWSMSAAELGSDPEDLERKLVQIFEVAARWRAILLLDEADVYLERRKDSTFSSLTQSAMTGVFLRMLEYYSGILFLTTNRMESVDDAICSRVSIFLEYKEFDKDQRLKIWKTFLSSANITNACSDTFCSEVADLRFNGREIRNVVHNAQILAKSKQETVTEDHILSALKIMGSSRVPKVFQIKDSVDTDTKSILSMPTEESHEEIDSIEYASSRNR